MSYPMSTMDNYTKIGMTTFYLVITTFLCAGIPVFKSSKVSIYVIYLTINELPPEDRKKLHNTLLLGI